MRPGTSADNAEEKDDWDDDFDQDWDTIDDQAWSLILKCCTPEPENRPDMATVKELVIDLKIWDDRPAAKAIPGAEILKLRSEPKIDLVRVEELLDQLQISDVVNGLHYLHELGIVHGDLKGQNILISDEGRGLITDFGASHITTATATSGSLSTTTLRFTAPEMLLGDKKPSKEFDIWSVGCLFYEVLSRKEPYYEYKYEVQIVAALSRKQPPMRPGTSADNTEEKDDWDDDFDQDWDTIDDQAWNLILKCCTPEPENRPNIATVKELVIDLKIWDDRPAAKTIPGAEILKLWSEPKIDLARVEELLDQLQVSQLPFFIVL
ncbi:Cytokinesis protein sepH [Leucoagaricus sp. SymC.cos]|nr:Cytokinesis protein sepH [Leucoagaricus sp. SymC.cos]